MFWLYAHVKRKESKEREWQHEQIKMLCSFIDPERAKTIFQDTEHVESTGFDTDILAIDPNIDMAEYQEIMESM